MKLPKNRQELFRIVKYLAVGGSTALLELFLFWLLTSMSINVVYANIAAVLVATATNFLLNGLVTFKSSSNMLRSAVLYCLLFAFNLCSSTTVIAFLSTQGLPAVAVKFCTQACIVCWNYLLYKKVIFKRDNLV